MPGCPNGATPASGSAGTQGLLSPSDLTAPIVDVFQRVAPTAFASLTSALFDVDTLCQVNPDPPRELTVLDFVIGNSYAGGIPGIDNPVLIEWLYEWLRYNAFLQHCVCNAVVVDPSLNCFHGTNISWGAGANVITPLGSVVIQAEVYDSWLLFHDGTQRIAFNLGKVTTSGLSGASNWAVQVLGDDGLWVDLFRGDAFPEGSHGDGLFTLNAQVAPLPNPVQLRVRSGFGGQSALASLDVCFTPLTAAAQPLPPDPNVPGVPTVPPPTCSTEDLCAIVNELARQLTRVSGQVSDIQAAVGGTDVLSPLGNFPLTGEGELDAVPGTRAVSVSLATLGPDAYTSALGRPRGLMRVGSLRWRVTNGFSPRVFIDGDQWVVPRPQGGLAISWQLLEGTTGTGYWLG